MIGKANDFSLMAKNKFIRIFDNTLIDSNFNMFIFEMSLGDMIHLVHSGHLFFEDGETSIMITLKREK